MLVTPPFGASSNIALWRAYSKPPVELVVADLGNGESMDKIKILKVEPGKPPCVKEIANDFKASQAEVEGDIECVGFGDGCVAVINAEGKLNGMQPNRRNGDDIICGPFFICGDTPDGDFISLTEQQIEEYTRRFGEIEQFTGQEPELEPHMTILAF